MSLLDEMAIETGLGRGEIQFIVATAPKRYKRYTIPKRSGGRREIAQPARELKLLQRFLHGRVLAELPVHEAAAAYVVGRGIRENAEVHRKGRVLLKLDFKDFFPSIKVRDWGSYLRQCSAEQLERAGLSEISDRVIATRLLFWGEGGREPRCLSIGAPTSPMLSNILMFNFDVAISALATERAVSYTRYADDVTLSGSSSRAVLDVETELHRAIKALKFPKLQLNEEKRGLFTMGQKRMVTGVVLTPDEKISLGRARKRAIHSLLYRFSLGLLTEAEVAYLKGMIGFANAIEPEFLTRLRSKYGNDPLDAVLRLHIPRRRVVAPAPPAVDDLS